MVTITSKSKLVVFLASIIGAMGVVLYFEATDQHNQAENTALLVLAALIIIVIGFALFGKRPVKITPQAVVPPAPTIKNYAFY